MKLENAVGGLTLLVIVLALLVLVLLIAVARLGRRLRHHVEQPHAATARLLIPPPTRHVDDAPTFPQRAVRTGRHRAEDIA